MEKRTCAIQFSMRRSYTYFRTKFAFIGLDNELETKSITSEVESEMLKHKFLCVSLIDILWGIYYITGWHTRIRMVVEINQKRGNFRHKIASNSSGGPSEASWEKQIIQSNYNSCVNANTCIWWFAHNAEHNSFATIRKFFQWFI